MVDFMQQGIQPYQPRSQGNNMLALLIQLKQLKQAESDRAYNRQRAAQSDAIDQARLELSQAEGRRAEERLAQSKIMDDYRKRQLDSQIQRNEAETRAYDVFSGIQQSNAQALQQVENPKQAEDLLSSVQDFMGSNSRTAKKVSSNVSGWAEKLAEPFVDTFLMNVQTTDVPKRMEWLAPMLNENSMIRGFLSDSQVSKARSLVSESLVDMGAQARSVMEPTDLVRTENLNPNDFRVRAEQQVQQLESLEGYIESEPLWATDENVGKRDDILNVAAKKRLAYQEKLNLVSRVHNDAVTGKPRLNSEEDADTYYNTFARNTLRNGPIENAVSEVLTFANQIGVLPPSMVQDLTDDEILVNDVTAFRFANILDQAEVQLPRSAWNKIEESVLEDPMKYRLLRNIRHMSSPAAAEAARQSGTYDQYISEVVQSARLASESLQSAAEDNAAQASADGDKILGDKRAQITGTIQSLISKRGNKLKKVTKDLPQGPARDMVGAYYFDGMHRSGNDEDYAAKYARSEIKKRSGPSFTNGETILYDPIYIATEEYGYKTPDEFLITEATREQFKKDFPGWRYSDVTTQSTMWVDDKGNLRAGYIFTGGDDKGYLNDTPWYPDLSPEGLYEASKGRKDLLRRHREFFPDSVQSQMESLTRKNESFQVRERLLRARRDFEASPGRGTRLELNRAQKLFLEDQGVDSLPDEILRIPVGPKRDAAIEKWRKEQ